MKYNWEDTDVETELRDIWAETSKLRARMYKLLRGFKNPPEDTKVHGCVLSAHKGLCLAEGDYADVLVQIQLEKAKNK